MKLAHVLLATVPAMAVGVAFAGPVDPFDNRQPSLVIQELVNPTGIYPSGFGGITAKGDMMGFVYGYAGSNALAVYPANGQTIPISQNQALFSLYGTLYGGDGVSSFGVPDLRGRALMGTGQAPGLSPRTLGVPVGADTVTPTAAQVPAPGQPAAALPVDTVQPSLPLTPLIAVNGVYPSGGGALGSAAFLGQVAWFGGNFTPSGWLPADGRLLPIAQNQALFSLLGTTYGGNGQTNFALPDLRGRIAVGADANNPLGELKGAETTTVQASQMPGPGQQPLPNDQPSLALHYIIAMSGAFPLTDGNPFDQDSPFVGQISLFAGTFAPSGWAFAEGQTLAISQNTALFAVLGTTYGGNGVTTFQLPNFDDRTAVGVGNGYAVGDAFGSDTVYLTGSVPPPVVPEPATWAMLAAGFAAMGLAGRRAGRQAAV